MEDTIPPRAEHFQPHDAPQNTPPGGNGSERMGQLAALIEQIMVAHAGGFNVPVQVDGPDGPEAVTPAQLLQDLCDTIYGLEIQVKRLNKSVKLNTELAMKEHTRARR